MFHEEDFDAFQEFDDESDEELPGGAPALVETGRTVGPDPKVQYVWSTGRIAVVTFRDRVRISRRWGRSGRIELRVGELPALLAALRAWPTLGKRWASFWSDASGYPPGFGRLGYSPPAEPVSYGGGFSYDNIPRKGSGPPPKPLLVGRDELVPLAVEREDAPGLVAVAELWRRGEHYGPPAGSLVGARYRVGERLFFDAKCTRAAVRRCDAAELEDYLSFDTSLDLERDDAPFLEALYQLRGGVR